MEFVRMSRERFDARVWDTTYSALAAEAEAGTDGLSLLTVKGDSSGAKTWSHIDAQKAAGPDAALRADEPCGVHATRVDRSTSYAGQQWRGLGRVVADCFVGGVGVTQPQLSFDAPADTYTARVAKLFKANPGRWIDGMEIAKVGGCYASRTRISECRTKLGMSIENRVRRIGSRKISEYRLVTHV